MVASLLTSKSGLLFLQGNYVAVWEHACGSWTVFTAISKMLEFFACFMDEQMDGISQLMQAGTESARVVC